MDDEEEKSKAKGWDRIAEAIADNLFWILIILSPILYKLAEHWWK